MPRQDIEFSTADHVTLRGWLYTPMNERSQNLPCLIMAHGWTAVKEMHLDAFAEYLTAHLPLACLVYDNRGFGASDAKESEPRHEIVPCLQQSDYSDCITYAQTLPLVDPNRIGIWGSSYSGGHVLSVGATDRRVKAVISQVPMVNGWETFNRLIRPDFQDAMNQSFSQDRIGRLKGESPAIIPVVDADVLKPSSLPTAESYAFFAKWMGKVKWENEVTLKSIELLRGNDPSLMIGRISPTPLLMLVAEHDVLTPTDIAIKSYMRAREPKTLHLLPGGHFDAYEGKVFEINAQRQVQFLQATLCAADYE